MTERDSTFTHSQTAPDTAPTPDATGSAAPALQGSSPGAMLRQLREAAGVDAALVASAMKVSLQKLDALENDRFDELPDLTFARGLASAICRAFGADPAPVLERMPLSAPGLRAQGHVANPPFRRVGDTPAPMLKNSFSKPLLIVVAALLLGALALWLLPTLPIQLTSPTSEPPVTADANQEPAAPVAEPAPPAEMPAGAASAEQSVASAPAPAGSGAEAAASSGSDLLTFVANAETWLTVRDANGKQLINRALASGETVKLNGEVPLAVTVGRKDAVTVTVRGEPFDHKSLSKTTVSRFQVK
ncbi:helix-turn-helix domain-containing protein [Ottowia flava]|uniref:Helix-turn-helix domain-containing protein n=1 Tax=Ottowia flava TaxID=2675430 RepID=A0ABW4KRX3_9BURK|nr:RodZ domain-containing protein [Ottowia sp. GY511]